MDRRDYILRLIEQAGRALIALRDRILGLEASTEQVREALRQAARLGGLDYELARAMTPRTLAMMVAPGGEVEPGRCWVLAESFYLDGLEASLDDRPGEAREALERARLLYGLLRPLAGNLVGIPEAGERIAEIEDRLDRLPPRRARTLRADGATGRSRPAGARAARAPRARGRRGSPVRASRVPCGRLPPARPGGPPEEKPPADGGVTSRTQAALLAVGKGLPGL